MIVGVRYSFPGSGAIEFTYHRGCAGTPEEWVKAHIRSEGASTVERFESDVPVHRRIETDGTITELEVLGDRNSQSPKDWNPRWPSKVTE